jgi:hypothetical protein
MTTIIVKKAGTSGKTVLFASHWEREPTLEPTPRHNVAGFAKKAAGYEQKAPGYEQKAPGFGQNPPPFFDFPRFSWWIAGKVLPLQYH